MKNLPSYISEKLVINQNYQKPEKLNKKKFLKLVNYMFDEFVDKQKNPANFDWEFLYDVLCEACPDDSKITKIGYDNSGRRRTNLICRIKSRYDILEFYKTRDSAATFDVYENEINIADDDKSCWINSEIGTAKNLLTTFSSKKARHFKITPEKINDKHRDVTEFLGIDPKKLKPLSVYINKYENINGHWLCMFGKIYSFSTSYFDTYVVLSIITHNSNKYKPLYSVTSIGDHAKSYLFYSGPNIDEFSKTLNELIEKDLNVK